MSWTPLATIKLGQDWQLTPAITAHLGLVRMSFATAGIPVEVAQIDPATGDIHDRRVIMATGYAQIFEFECPAVWESRAIAVRLPLVASPFDVTIELSSIPVENAGEIADVDLQPILNGQSQILSAIESIDIESVDIDVPTIDLSPVQSALSSLAQDEATRFTNIGGQLSNLGTYIEAMLETNEGQVSNISYVLGLTKTALETTQSAQNTVLNTIAQSLQTQDTRSSSILTQANKIDQVLNAVDTLETTQSAQDAVLNTIVQSLQGLTSTANQYTLITTTYTTAQSSFYSSTNIPGTYATLNDNNSQTGAATNNGSNQWLKATFPSAVTVRAVRLGGGNMTNWGSVASFLNGCDLQCSTDDLNWVTVANVSGVVDTNPGSFFMLPLGQAISARYWRLIRNGSGYVATTELRFFS